MTAVLWLTGLAVSAAVMAVGCRKVGPRSRWAPVLMLMPVVVLFGRGVHR